MSSASSPEYVPANYSDIDDPTIDSITPSPSYDAEFAESEFVEGETQVTETSVEAERQETGPMTADDLAVLKIEHLVPDEVFMKIPSEGDTATNPPEGFLTFYEHFLRGTYLWFPIPEVLTEFLLAFNLNMSQFTPNAIRAILGIVVRCYEVGINPTVTLLRSLLRICPGTRSIYYFVAAKAKGRRVIDDIPNKDDGWEKRFFFIRIDSDSFGEIYSKISNQWTEKVVSGGHRDIDSPVRVASELNRHGCLWTRDFSLARMVLARSLTRSTLPSLSMQHLSPEEFSLELKRRVDIKMEEINNEIDSKLLAKGLTRSKVVQPEATTSRTKRTRSDAPANKRASKKKKKTKEASPKIFEPNPYGRISSPFFNREGQVMPPSPLTLYLDSVSNPLSAWQESDVPKLSYEFECSQNETLRKELEKERQRSKELEKQLELLKSPKTHQRGDASKRASSPQELAAGVLRDDVVHLEERIETRFTNLRNKFINLMGQPLKDYVRYHEICNNIELTKEIKSDPSFDFDTELTNMAKDKLAMEPLKAEFERKAKSIPSLFNFTREWFPHN